MMTLDGKYNQEDEVSEYLPQHYYSNQVNWLTDIIPINPCQRDDFDSTPHEHRDPLELDHWWNVPYVQTCEWSDIGSDDDERREQWFAHWPSGIRYTVRCLDGGAWDRSTNRGSFSSLEQAVAAIGSMRAGH
ncbi:hypothetical protein KAM369_43030 [Aeromonas caviae]|nr:hypothetical protein KAM369_43030 [Aeromonas caviae]GJB66271.1 hypothetical protein KAM375_43250 [Aeromonas caviae]